MPHQWNADLEVQRRALRGLCLLSEAAPKGMAECDAHELAIAIRAASIFIGAAVELIDLGASEKGE